MNEVKVFCVTGEITKPNFRTKFRKEIKAIRPDDAVEKVLTILGSKHRVKRFYICIKSVQEIWELLDLNL